MAAGRHDQRAVEALIRSLQGLVDFAIYLGIAVLPILRC